MKNNNKNKEPSHLKYWDVNNFYRWAMSQKLPENGFKWVEETSQFNEDFIESYNEDSDEGYLFEVDFQFPEKLHESYNELPFLPKRMRTEKVKKFVANLHDKKKQDLSHGLVFKKVHRVIEFNQKALLKSYIDMEAKK